MKKGKEWLKEEINKMMKIANYKSIFFSPRMSCILYADLIKVIDQLDEPEKVVIPRFVADYIEKDKKRELGSTVWHGLCGLSSSEWDWDEPKNVYRWVFEYRDNVDLFARAYLNGYTIEQPKLLTVIVKDYDKTIMTKQMPENEVNKMMEGME